MIHEGSNMTVASRFGSLKCEWLQGSRMEGEYQGVEGDRAVLGDLDLREGRGKGEVAQQHGGRSPPQSDPAQMAGLPISEQGHYTLISVAVCNIATNLPQPNLVHPAKRLLGARHVAASAPAGQRPL